MAVCNVFIFYPAKFQEVGDWTTSFSSNSVMSEKNTTTSFTTKFHFTSISNHICKKKTSFHHFSIASGLSKNPPNEALPRWEGAQSLDWIPVLSPEVVCSLGFFWWGEYVFNRSKGRRWWWCSFQTSSSILMWDDASIILVMFDLHDFDFDMMCKISIIYI